MSAKPWRQLHGASYLVTFSQDFPFQPDRQIASCPGCTRLWGMAVNTWTTNKFSQWTVALHLSNWNVFPYFIRPIPTHLSKAGQAAPFQPIFIICFIQIPWLLSLQSIDVWIIFLNFFFTTLECKAQCAHIERECGIVKSIDYQDLNSWSSLLQLWGETCKHLLPWFTHL